MEDNKKIDLTNLPEEPFVDILDPDGNVIWHGNSVLHLDYIRVQIKRGKLTGYKLRTEKNNIYKINELGRITDLIEDGERPGDIWMKLVLELL